MKKKIFTFILTLTLALSFTKGAFAVDQKPNSEVFLGSFEVVYALDSAYSKYCTATQDHVKLRISVSSSGSAKAIVQYRGPNETWQNLGSTTKSVNSSYTFDINAKKGNDYRLHITAGGLKSSGTVVCY